MTTRRKRRSGFTLLEVLLSSAIAIMLLGALYSAFDLTLRQADAGREAVAQGDLARAVMNRMAIDFAGCLGPLPPKSGGGLPTDTATTSGTSTSATSSSGTTTAATGVAVLAAAGTSSDLTNTTSDGGGSVAVAADVPFQAGLFGAEKQATLYVSRVPPSLVNRETAIVAAQQQPADMLRVTYYLSSHGKGLCRQVRPWVTADGVRNSTDPDRTTEETDLIAEEVTDVSFEYLDAGSWLSAWDGSQPKTDGKTPMGPPRAIKVRLTITPAGGTQTKQVEHVFPVRAAVGLFQPPVPDETEGM